MICAAQQADATGVLTRYILVGYGFLERFFERYVARPWHLMADPVGAGAPPGSSASAPVPTGGDAESATPPVEAPTPAAPAGPGPEDAEETGEETSWSYTPEWQEGERRVDEYIRRGEVREADSVDALIDRLERLEAEAAKREQGADSLDPAVRE